MHYKTFEQTGPDEVKKTKESNRSAKNPEYKSKFVNVRVKELMNVRIKRIL